MAPVPNRASSLRSGRLPAGAANAIDQKHGQANNQVPARTNYAVWWPSVDMLVVVQPLQGV